MARNTIFFGVHIQYSEKVHGLHNNLPFLPEKVKSGEVKKPNLHDKTRCYSHYEFKANFKPLATIKKVHRMIKFNQKAWLKLYIDMNIHFVISSKKLF